MPKMLLLGGLTTAYHYFGEMGPIITKTLEPAGFEVISSEDLAVLTEENLKNYAAVLNFTTGRELSDAQFAALKAFVEGGGGYVGIHNATDSFKNQPGAIALIGGVFRTHPAQLSVPVEIVDPQHEVTRGIPPFTVFDELYVMDHYPDTYHLLAQTHAHETQPIAWVREQGQGRVFYLSLGHNKEVFSADPYARLLRRGAQWAARQPVTA